MTFMHGDKFNSALQVSIDLVMLTNQIKKIPRVAFNISIKSLLFVPFTICYYMNVNKNEHFAYEICPNHDYLFVNLFKMYLKENNNNKKREAERENAPNAPTIFVQIEWVSKKIEPKGIECKKLFKNCIWFDANNTHSICNLRFIARQTNKQTNKHRLLLWLLLTNFVIFSVVVAILSYENHG